MPRHRLGRLLLALVTLIGTLAAAGPAAAQSERRETFPYWSAVPVQAPPTPDQARKLFDKAEAQRQIGEREAAYTTLDPLVDHPDRAIAAEAGFRRAQLKLELGDSAAAIAGAQALLGRLANVAPWADRARLLLGVARRQAGDCPGAVAALTDYLARANLLEAQVSLQLAQCYQQLGDAAAALDRTERVLQLDAPRLARIDALERQADLLEKGGDLEGALARYRRLLELARTAGYKADLYTTLARLSGQTGRDDEVPGLLAAAIAAAPSRATAGGALDRLAELQALGQVSYFQAGLVRFYQRRYERAIENFDGALASPAEAATQPAAAYYRAVARVRLGQENEGARDLLALPGAFPASPYASDALLRGGKILESNGVLAEALAAYRRVASDYPTGEEAPEALFRLGFASLQGGAPADANAAWARLAGSDAAPDDRALALLWQGKLATQAGDPAARTFWQRAVEAGATWYGGLRARELLEGNLSARPRPIAVDPARLDVSQRDLAELDAWTAARGAPLATITAELAAEPALARADELLAAGLKTEAGWELAALSERSAADPARLAGLALALRQRGLAPEALRQVGAAISAANVSSRETPSIMQRLLYPLPYYDLLTGAAQKQGVDPLLLAALVRQESAWQADARSSANALGLTQVLPSTGQGIASALGRPGFQDSDLFRPAVSLEFGAYYLSQRLKGYGGALFPALASYNAGSGAVDEWLKDLGSDDVDLFAERIPYPETSHYVKIVYENYQRYRSLYGKS